MGNGLAAGVLVSGDCGRGWWRGCDGKWLGFIVLAALVDDILDGVLARRWGCDTAEMRRADSWADTVFYLGVAGPLWLREEQLMRGNWRLLAALGAMEVRSKR